MVQHNRTGGCATSAGPDARKPQTKVPQLMKTPCLIHLGNAQRSIAVRREQRAIRPFGTTHLRQRGKGGSLTFVERCLVHKALRNAPCSLLPKNPITHHPCALHPAILKRLIEVVNQFHSKLQKSSCVNSTGPKSRLRARAQARWMDTHTH